MPLQDYQVGTNDLNSAMFQRRYEPNFAWGNAVSAMQMLPQLRGLWPMSSVDINGDVYDLSAQGHPLTNFSATPFGLDGLVPYADPDGAADYLFHLNHPEMEVTGALCTGGWFWFDSLATEQVCISKWNTTGNQRSYKLSVLTTGAPQVQISVDGTAVFTVAGTAGEVVVNQWYFLIMHVVPSVEVSVHINKLEHQNTVGVPAGIFDSTSRFMIGGVNNTTAALNGRAALCFLCASNSSDAIMRALYEQTRALFGIGLVNPT